jgi:TonB family protein
MCFTSLAMSAPIVAQDSNGSASAQQSTGARVVYKVGGDVSAPILIHSVEPVSDTNVSGSVQVTLWVDRNGLPSHVHVTRGLGMVLDEKAIDAVHLYRYKPAMKDDKPVMVELNVEVKFQKSAN